MSLLSAMETAFPGGADMQLHFVRQLLFKWILDSGGLPVIRPECDRENDISSLKNVVNHS